MVLIGSSRGGNAIRNALKHGGVAPRVSHAILGGTPSHGAYLSDNDCNEFNGLGPVLRDLNSGGEVVSGVAYLTIRSDTNALYAQPGGAGYDGPALAGATNVVIPDLDHNETATSARAFAAMLRFLTGEEATGTIPEEERVTLNGRVTGFLGAVPTNLGVAGVAVTVYALDPATGARRGDPLLARTTGSDGVWGPLTTDARTPLEFAVAAPGEPARHTFRAPFPRSSASVGLAPLAACRPRRCGHARLHPPARLHRGRARHRPARRATTPRRPGLAADGGLVHHPARRSRTRRADRAQRRDARGAQHPRCDQLRGVPLLSAAAPPHRATDRT